MLLNSLNCKLRPLCQLLTFSFSLILLTPIASQAQKYEHHRMQKNFKSYGMGGASLLQGGSTLNMLSNPTNLNYLPTEYGWDINLLGATVGYSQDSMAFFNDLNSALSKSGNEKNSEILNVLEKYIGKNLNLNLSLNAMAVSKKVDDPQSFMHNVSVGMVPLINLAGNLRTHSGFGSAGLLETNLLFYSGLAFAFSKHMEVAQKDLVLGIGIKWLTYNSLQKNFSVTDLVDSDVQTKIQNDYVKTGSSLPIDLGVTYPNIMDDDKSSLDATVVYSNIGGIGDSGSVHIPATLDMGMKYFYQFNALNKLTLLADLIDLTDAYNDDRGLKKRFNVGADMRLLQWRFLEFGVQAGLHQGYTTFGFDMLLGIFQVGYAQYKEELGVYAGQDGDERKVFHFSMRW